MKKLFITIAFVAAAFFAQAQLFVGGSLGLDMGSTKVESTKTQKTFTFEFAPTVGYMFSQNMGVGVDILFSTDKTKTPKIEDEPESANITTTFGFAPYFRYVFHVYNKFNVYADAKINVEFGKDKVKSDGKTFDGDKTTTFGINIIPGVQYCFNDHLSMVASLDILRLGFKSETTKSKDETFDPVTGDTKEKEVKTTNNDFGFGVNEAKAPITIGFVYSF